MKSLLVRADKAYRLVAVDAAQPMSSRAARRALGVRKLRFARPEELYAETGLVPGGVPPFGQPLLPVPLVADTALREVPRILFGGGAPQYRVLLEGDDWRRLARPEFAPLTESEDGSSGG